MPARRARVPGFNQHDSYLSFSDATTLGQKQRTDRLAAEIEGRRRVAINTTLLAGLESLRLDRTISPQERGKTFERWFGQLFAAAGLRHEVDVRNDHEQLDFTVWVGSHFCVGEARWLSSPVDTKQVRDFFGKLMDRPPFVIGVLISMTGFTEPAKEWVSDHTHDRTIILLDRRAVTEMVSKDNSFAALIGEKLDEPLKHLGS